jgi:alkaline phosphatase D
MVVVSSSPHFLKTILFGIPSPVSFFWTAVTFLINILCIFVVWDIIWHGPILYKEHDLSFARVGFVSYDGAKILIRETHINQYPVSISYRHAGPPLTVGMDSAWKHVTMIGAEDFTNRTDYTAHVEITHLRPDTRYQYAISNNHSGYFTTAPLPGHFPKWRDGTFTFLFTSCMIPRFPYDPRDHVLRFRGLEHLSNWIPALNPSFMLFLGDFIYVDVPKRLGTDVETYRSEYRRVYASPSWPGATAELPWIHVIDDHEIANDWDRNTTGLYAAAVDPWTHYQVSVNPKPVKVGHTYFSFTQGPTSFFMLDTRRYRSPESKNATDPSKTMIGAQQLIDLLHWIKSKPPHGVRFKVVASSVPLTKNWHFAATDTWSTYLHERRIILEAMHEAIARHGVQFVFISGDRHEFAATKLNDPNRERGADVWEFSVSPLNMFYVPTRTYSQQDDEDEVIKYVPDGQIKWGAIEISTSKTYPAESYLHFRLFIHGRESWNITLSSLTGKVIVPVA